MIWGTVGQPSGLTVGVPTLRTVHGKPIILSRHVGPSCLAGRHLTRAVALLVFLPRSARAWVVPTHIGPRVLVRRTAWHSRAPHDCRLGLQRPELPGPHDGGILPRDGRLGGRLLRRANVDYLDRVLACAISVGGCRLGDVLEDSEGVELLCWGLRWSRTSSRYSRTAALATAWASAGCACTAALTSIELQLHLQEMIRERVVDVVHEIHEHRVGFLL